MDNPSFGEANKLLRVLSGQRLKYTVRVHLPTKEVIEWQSDRAPAIKFLAEDRSVWLVDGEYGSNIPIMRWPEGSIMLMEENPKA